MTSESAQNLPHKGQRLGLYGGSFDPVHTGHLAVADRAREAFDLSQVWFLPASVPPHKLGKRLAVCDIRILSAVDETLVAHATATYSIPPRG